MCAPQRVLRRFGGLAAAVLATIAVTAMARSAPVSASGREPALVPPTDAPVLDPFRLPDGPYGPGNRGIEYGTAPGDPIGAAGAGVVSFAGQVASSLFITVDHGSGLKSTAGFVGRLVVEPGEAVAPGDLIAFAAGPFHFGLRLHGSYVDPTRFLYRRVTRVRLVPHESDPTDAPTRRVNLQIAGVRATSVLRGLLRGALSPSPATLLDGPNGPRMASGRRRRNHWARATPGRCGVRHEIATGKKEVHGSHLHEAAAGGRRSLRPPDPPVEPEDEAVHPRRAIRHPHRGSPSDTASPRTVLRLRS